LAVNSGVREDETLMQILSNIEKLNKDGIKPDLHDLTKRVKLTKSHLDLTLSELFKKGYIDSESNVRDYCITSKDKNILQRHKRKVQHFVDSIMLYYRNNEKVELYKLVTENKDLLWFAYYERIITKKEIQSIAKKLGVSIARMWWDKSIQHLGSLYEY